jgi:hypothetical protein
VTYSRSNFNYNTVFSDGIDEHTLARDLSSFLRLDEKVL